MGSSWYPDVDAGTCPRLAQLSPPLDMARAHQIVQCLLVLFAFAAVFAGPVVKRDAMSDGDGESIYAFQGFYGSPIYRPYGFASWGYGSPGFGRYKTYVAEPNIYGGYKY